MKILSIRNPWSYLIGLGIKDVENRKFKTNYRGTVFIHSPIQWDKRFSYSEHPFNVDQFFAIPENIKIQINQKELHTSCIIGEFTLVNCISNSKSIWAELDYWHWIIEDAILYRQPITAIKGKLGLWNITDKIALEILQAEPIKSNNV